MSSKITIKQIRVTRAEGPHEWCDLEECASSFEEADSILLQSSYRNSGKEGYDKHDVVFIWEDSTEMKCRFDVKHPEASGYKDVNTTEHLKRFANYYIENTVNGKATDFARRLSSELAIED